MNTNFNFIDLIIYADSQLLRYLLYLYLENNDDHNITNTKILFINILSSRKGCLYLMSRLNTVNQCPKYHICHKLNSFFLKKRFEFSA